MRNNNTKLYEKIAVLESEMALLRQARHERNVNNFLSALVRTSPEVFDAVMYSISGGIIGIPASVGWVAMGNAPTEMAHVWGICVSGGVTCAIVRLACAAVDLPIIVGGVVEKYFDWRDRRDERKTQEPQPIQPILMDDSDYSVDPQSANIPLEEQSVTIRQRDTKHSERIVPLGDLWHFLKISFETGDWSRDGWGIRWGKPSGWQALWADYKYFLSLPKNGHGDPLWWRTKDPPTLARALRQLRCPTTNVNINEPTNG
jgi:hypothetical protein